MKKPSEHKIPCPHCNQNTYGLTQGDKTILCNHCHTDKTQLYQSWSKNNGK